MRIILGKIEDIICALCLIVMTALTFANVIARYVFSASFSFSEEITTYLFVLLSLIGSAAAARRKAHLGFTAILDLFSVGAKRLDDELHHGISVLIGIVLLRHQHGVESNAPRSGDCRYAMARMDFRRVRTARRIFHCNRILIPAP